ncbi:hypothetical protein BGX27_000861 [Mortierella sp. AM989]|nr:hypothetical protein BGX27_000861 [Mortierella sp. AM989]
MRRAVRSLLGTKAPKDQPIEQTTITATDTSPPSRSIEVNDTSEMCAFMNTLDFYPSSSAGAESFSNGQSLRETDIYKSRRTLDDSNGLGCQDVKGQREFLNSFTKTNVRDDNSSMGGRTAVTPLRPRPRPRAQPGLQTRVEPDQTIISNNLSDTRWHSCHNNRKNIDSQQANTNFKGTVFTDLGRQHFTNSTLSQGQMSRSHCPKMCNDHPNKNTPRNSEYRAIANSKNVPKSFPLTALGNYKTDLIPSSKLIFENSTNSSDSSKNQCQGSDLGLYFYHEHNSKLRDRPILHEISSQSTLCEKSETDNDDTESTSNWYRNPAQEPFPEPIKTNVLRWRTKLNDKLLAEIEHLSSTMLQYKIRPRNYSQGTICSPDDEPYLENPESFLEGYPVDCRNSPASVVKVRRYGCLAGKIPKALIDTSKAEETSGSTANRLSIPEFGTHALTKSRPGSLATNAPAQPKLILNVALQPKVVADVMLSSEAPYHVSHDPSWANRDTGRPENTLPKAHIMKTLIPAPWIQLTTVPP